MYIGRYYHRLEEKGRVSLPKAFRDTTQSWIITRGLDGGLFLFKKDEFKQRLGEIDQRTFTKKNHRDFIRLMVNDARELTVDANGRVTLPDYLILKANLKKEVVIVGSYSYLEIWSQEEYHTYLDTLDDGAEAIAESLDETHTSSTN